MSPIDVAEAIVLLLAAAVVLAWLARRLDVPDPVVLVAGGAVLAFLPLGVDIKLDPDIVLLLFVAPLLYARAYYAPIGELRNNSVSIALLASVLVVVTAVAVAVVAHEVLDMPWDVAFVLGAALGATDALAPVQVMSGAGADPRLVAVVQGESLFNDVVAFALVGAASAAAVSGSFDALSSAAPLALSVGGGVALGIAVAWLVGQGRRRTDHVLVEAGLSLLTPFAAYIAAGAVHRSRILAAGAPRVWLGQGPPGWGGPPTRRPRPGPLEVIAVVLHSLPVLLVGPG